MSGPSTTFRKKVTKESALLVVLLLTGLILLPIAIYFVGNAVFGEYAGDGFRDFYGTLQAQLRRGAPVVWLLVLAPYLIWQLLRFTVRGFRAIRAHGRR